MLIVLYKGPGRVLIILSLGEALDRALVVLDDEAQELVDLG